MRQCKWEIFSIKVVSVTVGHPVYLPNYTQGDESGGERSLATSGGVQLGEGACSACGLHTQRHEICRRDSQQQLDGRSL